MIPLRTADAGFLQALAADWRLWHRRKNRCLACGCDRWHHLASNGPCLRRRADSLADRHGVCRCAEYVTSWVNTTGNWRDR